MNLDDETEWLEADALGGFASGTVAGPRTRRYHALLLTATQPPSGRAVLANGVEAWLETPAGRFPLSTHSYAPDVTYPNGRQWLVDFTPVPWPTWTFQIPDGPEVIQEILVDRAACETLVRWRITGEHAGTRLTVRPLLSGRDYHALHRENTAFRFDPQCSDGNVCWQPYAAWPPITALTNGVYTHGPEWFRQFLYQAEADRGLDHIEDLASPGWFEFALGHDNPAFMILRTGSDLAVSVDGHAAELLQAEGIRRSKAGATGIAAESYLVDRLPGRTVIAGFPWFGDWGRDTFIAMRGLVIERGDLDDAERILVAWAATVSEGMLPNRFPDAGAPPEYNSVDASLWFIVVVHEFLLACEANHRAVTPGTSEALSSAAKAILTGYMQGTRFGIGADADGLLRAGMPGSQLTWMDAKVGDTAITPRWGKPVEVQALWINALSSAATHGWGDGWAEAAAKAREAFRQRFVPGAAGLPDVVDVEGTAGKVDGTLRPNQIFAVGGLPFQILDGEAAGAVVNAVEAALLTPLGLRTLAPTDPAYVGHYGGAPFARDSAYHQGTVWPWLMGAFVDAWLAIRGRSPEAKAEGRRRFLPPLVAHLGVAGLGHISEVADGDPPHRPGGCPFQAWSLGEFLRIRRMLDASDADA